MEPRKIKTAEQQEIANRIAQKFGIDADKILFLNKFDALEPWIPPRELMAIAREYGNFTKISVDYNKFIPETSQVICTAILVTERGSVFSNFGVATTKVGEEIGAEVVASGRALSAVLNDAGFNPLKSNPIIDLKFDISKATSETELIPEGLKRTRDIRRIKALATDLGMIVNTTVFGEKVVDDTEYRWFLHDKFPDLFPSMEKPTIINLSAENRQRVIDKLMEEQRNTEILVA